MYKKVILFALSILGAPCAMHGMELVPQYRSEKEQEELNEQLCKAMHAGDLRLIEKLLQAGANPNMQVHTFLDKEHRFEPSFHGPGYHTTALSFSMYDYYNMPMCKLLLDYGANLETQIRWPLDHAPHVAKSKSKLFDLYNLIFDYGASLYNRHKWSEFRVLQSNAHYSLVPNMATECLIICSLFNPKFDQFSYKKIISILFALKRHGLPKDLRSLILTKYLNLTSKLQEIPHPKRLSAIKEETAHTIPIKFVRELVAQGKLNPQATVAALKKNHIACLKPLMAEALPLVDRADFNYCNVEERRRILDPEKLEESYGDAIERNIRRRLGLLEWYEQAYDALPENPCSIQ